MRMEEPGHEHCAVDRAPPAVTLEFFFWDPGEKGSEVPLFLAALAVGIAKRWEPRGFSQVAAGISAFPLG